jgi:hypothetical protein
VIAPYLLGALVAKAAGERPELLPASYGAADLRLVGAVGGVSVDLNIHADGIAVGGSTEAVATCQVSMYGVLARALRSAGCTREAIAALVTEATAAELRGEVDPIGAEIEASVAALRKSFAASLPKVARAGAVSVKGARLSLPVAAEAAMAAK